LELVPTKVLMRRFCLSALKKSSICQRWRSLGTPILRPVEDRGTEFNQPGIEAQQLVLEAEAVPSGDFAAAPVAPRI